MAVATDVFPDLLPVAGIRLGTACAGIKQSQRDDLAMIEMNAEAVCSAVFTQNAFCAAPVTVAQSHLEETAPRWLLINSGNANAGTGSPGVDDARSTCHVLAQLMAGDAQEVLPFSTGVIGEPLPVSTITQALPQLVQSLGTASWQQVAEAIMTTDTVPKGAGCSIRLGHRTITINGVCKGSGMIQPNMATMLAFLATDANVPEEALQQCLLTAVETSFNCITVDGDTSTNDACVLIATGTSGPAIHPRSDDWLVFQTAVTDICQQLAEKIIQDGEGATKLMRIRVEEAFTVAEAHQVAKTIAHSPLVKTAFFASDPNWGRILAAVGRSGIDALDVSKISIWLGEVCIVREGMRANDYQEQSGQAVMNQNEIIIRVLLGRGEASQQVLSCDLSYDYVRINAEYRT